MFSLTLTKILIFDVWSPYLIALCSKLLMASLINNASTLMFNFGSHLTSICLFSFSKNDRTSSMAPSIIEIAGVLTSIIESPSSWNSILDNFNRSSMISFIRFVCLRTLSINNFSSSLEAVPLFNTSTNPAIEVIGVFSSWLTFDTKSCLTFSSFFTNVKSFIVIRLPVFSPLTIKGVPVIKKYLGLSILIQSSFWTIDVFDLRILLNNETVFLSLIWLLNVFPT